jgi:beta-hydroxylase
MFKKKSDYPFLKEFEENWIEIKSEYEAAKERLIDWPQNEIYNEGWKTFAIFEWPSGRELIGGSICPVLKRLIKSYVPSHGAVGFSRLGPGTVIEPHSGFDGDFLRMHLALQVPKGDCALRCNKEKIKWKEGKAFVFDDRLEHEAWNRTHNERVVLIVDFVP